MLWFLLLFLSITPSPLISVSYLYASPMFYLWSFQYMQLCTLPVSFLFSLFHHVQHWHSLCMASSFISYLSHFVRGHPISPHILDKLPQYNSDTSTLPAHSDFITWWLTPFFLSLIIFYIPSTVDISPSLLRCLWWYSRVNHPILIFPMLLLIT